MKTIEPNWPAPKNIKACTTLRHNWGNTPHRPNDAASTQALIELLNLPEAPFWIDQKHTATVVEAISPHQNQIADAMFTSQPNRVCAILTADCLPLLICNQQGTFVATIHGGWRGLAADIIAATLKALPPPHDELLVWLGPAIGPQKFEVGRDVYDAFTVQHPETALAFTPYKEDKWLANIYTLATLKLNEHGITHIYGGDYCTYTQEDLFFSYRRDQGQTGRMASLIWIA